MIFSDLVCFSVGEGHAHLWFSGATHGSQGLLLMGECSRVNSGSDQGTIQFQIQNSGIMHAKHKAY